MKLFALLLFIFSACGRPEVKTLPKPTVNTRVAKKNSAEKPSAEVEKYIKNEFAGWSLASKSDYIKSWWSFYDNKSVPYFVATDINDDQLSDYGLILKKSDSIKVVILVGDKNSFKHWVAKEVGEPFNFNLKNLQLGLTIEPPGRIDIAYPAIKSLILKSNAINVMEFENRLCIYYWLGEKIEVFN